MRISDWSSDVCSSDLPGLPEPEGTPHLALWHGLEPALWITLATLVLGVVVFIVTARKRRFATMRVLPFTASDAYNAILRAIARLAVFTTSLTQRGSLPVYVGTIFKIGRAHV